MAHSNGAAKRARAHAEYARQAAEKAMEMGRWRGWLLVEVFSGDLSGVLAGSVVFSLGLGGFSGVILAGF